MATDLAAAPIPMPTATLTPNPVPIMPSPDAVAPEPRRYWQLPTFLAGAVALVAAFFYAPKPTTNPVDSHVANRASLVTALQAKPIDPIAVESLAKQVAEDADRYPDSANLSHFLAGSGFLALAENSPEDTADWLNALKQFEQCDATKLEGPKEAAKLVFRTAKARAATDNGDANAVMLALAASTPPDEDRSEWPRLIARTATRATPANLKLARDELTNYLGGTNRASPAMAANCKLELAKLNLTLNDPAKARTWLNDIGADAPVEVLASAKVQLARLALADNNWPEAVKLFEAAQSTPGLPPEQLGAIRYFTGYALLKQGETAQAMPYLEQAAKDPATVAIASLRLAELKLRDPMAKGLRTEVVEYLEKAVTPTDSTMEAVSHADLKAVFEQVIQTSKDEGDFPSALRAAAAYGKIDTSTKAAEYRAEIQTTWAEGLEKVSVGSADAKSKYLGAAKEFAALGELETDAERKMAHWMKAIKQYRRADDSASATSLVDKILASPTVTAEQIGQAWVEKAEMLPASDFAAIKAALEKAMAVPSSAANAARYRLATLHVARGNELLAAAPTSLSPDQVKQEAEATAKFGRDLYAQLADAATVAPQDAVTHERAIFELGKMLMRDQAYPEAESRFRKQLALYPTGTYADQGRLWMVSALLARAKKDSTTADKIRTEALEYLKPLSQSNDPFLRNWGEIWTVNTLVEMGDTAAAVAKGKELIAKHTGTPEELVVGSLVFHAALAAKSPDLNEAARTLAKMEEALPRIPRETFPKDARYSYEHWKSELPKLREKLTKQQ